MRIKISFYQESSSADSIPLHHQKLLADALKPVLRSVSDDPSLFNFSSIKGTSKIMKGFMRMLSSKVTLVISSRKKEMLEQAVNALFKEKELTVSKMKLLPKSYVHIPDPEFGVKMRYLCISPLILHDPAKEPHKAQEQPEPSSHAFSDILYNVTLDKMEKAGYSESQLSSFAEFEYTPDADYVHKITAAGKKFVRHYQSSSGNSMAGYLLPFTLHAHPLVQEFIWQSGIGALTEEGYGMVDIVKQHAS